MKLVVDKIPTGDRYQVLALLKNIKHYLETGDLSHSATFDEPLVTVTNLIHSIDDLNILKQSTTLQGIVKKPASGTSPLKSRSSNSSSSRCVVEFGVSLVTLATLAYVFHVICLISVVDKSNRFTCFARA